VLPSLPPDFLRKPAPRPILEALAEIMKDAPAEDMAMLPKDGRIDDYVYGLPSRDP
jgi:hypothetical protein